MQTSKHWNMDPDERRISRRKLEAIHYRVHALRMKQELRKYATF